MHSKTASVTALNSRFDTSVLGTSMIVITGFNEVGKIAILVEELRLH